MAFQRYSAASKSLLQSFQLRLLTQTEISTWWLLSKRKNEKTLREDKHA